MWRMYIEGEYTLPIFTAIVFSPIDGFLTARQIKQTDIGILNIYITLTISPPIKIYVIKIQKNKALKKIM